MYHCIMIIQYMSIILMIFEVAYIFAKWETRGHSYLFVYCASALINNVSYLLLMTADNANEAFAYAKICYLGKVWIPLSFFAMIMMICEIRIPNKLFGVLISIHAMVLMLVITSDWHYLYYTSDRKFIKTDLFPYNSFGHTLIYYLYQALVVSYILIGFIVLIVRLVGERDKRIKKIYSHLMWASLAMIAGFSIYMTKIFPGYDATNLGFAICSVILLVVIRKYDFMDFLSLVKDYVADTISEGIIAVDEKGKIIYFNTPMMQLYPELEKKSKRIVPELEKTVNEDSVIRRDNKVYEAEKKILYRGEIEKGCVYVITDVTARYRHMQELQEQKEIAEAANASKSAFVSTVSHEIRTPMNAIVGMTDMILKESDNLTEAQKKYLNNIKKSGDSLVLIVNDILDQSKIESGKMELVEDTYEIRSLVDDIKMIIENRAGGKPVEIIEEIDSNVPAYLYGDSLRIRQILINLMNNAVKFTEKGYVKLCIDRKDKENDSALLRFSVEDSGQGIRKEDLEKLGKAFAQVDLRKNHMKEGTGLGLAISKDLIELMGGQLEIESEYGKEQGFIFQ